MNGADEADFGRRASEEGWLTSPQGVEASSQSGGVSAPGGQCGQSALAPKSAGIGCADMAPG